MKHPRTYFQELFAAHNSPQSLAWGAGIGTLIAVLPTPGIGILAGFLVLLLFPRLSKFSLFGAMALFNPFVLAPLYYASFQLGSSILNSQVVEKLSMLEYLTKYTGTFLLGNVIIAFGAAVIMYFVVFGLAKWYNSKHQTDRRVTRKAR
ncbi:MAG: DUF2062 domain-containing protein [Candidatus Woesearchaeota archaeon]